MKITKHNAIYVILISALVLNSAALLATLKMHEYSNTCEKECVAPPEKIEKLETVHLEKINSEKTEVIRSHAIQLWNVFKFANKGATTSVAIQKLMVHLFYTNCVLNLLMLILAIVTVKSSGSSLSVALHPTADSKR
jgi:hypothetical protein